MSEQFGVSPSGYRKIWSSLESERLVHLYKQGLSYSEIGYWLDRKRNQVAAKVRRLALDGVIKGWPYNYMRKE